MANTLNLGNGNWATKEDSLLAYNSENGNFKPLPFDFTRASSATVVNKAGLIETVGSGEPRIDFSSDAKGALKLEPAKTNLFLTSASGVYGSSPASETNTISPDGTLNAVIPTPDTTSNRYQYDVSSGTYATNTKLAYSWYRKRISTPIDTSHIGDLHIKSLSNASQVGSTTQIESDVNGFDRFQAVLNITDGSLPSIIRGYFGGVVGIGNSSVAYFGHQMELGDFSTSYIPTSGSAVTRTVEYSKILNQPILKATNKFTMFFDAPKFLEVNGGVGSFDNVMLNLGAAESAYDSGGGLHIYNKVWYYNSGSVSTNIGICYNSLTDSKFAISYDGTSFHKYANGVKIASIALSASMVNWDTFQTSGMNDAQLDERSWNLKNLKLYNTALTDAELQALTTI